MSRTETSHATDEAVWGEIPAVREPVYRIDERPETWWESVLYGWQHTLVDLNLLLNIALGGEDAEV